MHRAEPPRPNLGYYLGFMEYRKKNYRKALNFFQAAIPSDDKFAQLTRLYTGLAGAALGFPHQAHAEAGRALPDKVEMGSKARKDAVECPEATLDKELVLQFKRE